MTTSQIRRHIFELSIRMPYTYSVVKAIYDRVGSIQSTEEILRTATMVKKSPFEIIDNMGK